LSKGILLIQSTAPTIFENYQVYIKAYDSFKWGGDSDQYFADISLYDGCIYPEFKQNPSNININLGFFKDNTTYILPLASFNTNSMTLISNQNISFMKVEYI